MAENITSLELNGIKYALGKSIYTELDLSLERFVELLGRDFYCPTLNSAPTSTTLTYKDTDDSVNTFQIGQPCRWKESDGIYRLAVLADMTSSTATWYILPTKVSELTNDAGYLTHDEIQANVQAVDTTDIVDEPAGVTYLTTTVQHLTEEEKNQVKENIGVNDIELNSQDILSKIKEVDGAGSGLDADTLDGFHRDYFFKSISSLDFNGTTADFDTHIIRFTNTNADSNHPYSVIGGNQCIVLNLYCNQSYAAQLAMGFGSPTLAYRNKSGKTTWGEWRKINAGHCDSSTKASQDNNGNIISETYQEKIDIIDHGTSDTTFALTPNVLHKWGEVSSLTLSLSAASNETVANYYMVEFVSGATPTSLAMPDSIAWASDLTIEANKTYQISILNGCGVIGGF